MKRNELLFAALLVPIDYLAVCLAGWTAYSLRFHQIANVVPATLTTPFGEFMRVVFLIAWIWVLFLAIQGAYAIRQRSMSGELGRVAMGASLAVLMLIVAIFFRRELITSRFIVVAGWIISIGYLWLSHILVRSFQRALLRQGIGVKGVVLIGNDATTRTLIEAFHTMPSLGMKVMKVFPEVSLDTLTEFEQLLDSDSIDEVLQSDPTIPKAQTLQILERCNDRAVTFKYAADMFETETGRIEVSDIAGIPIMEVKRSPLDGWGRILKRSIDIVGSTAGIVVLAIPGIIIAAIIKADSTGPVLMKLERIGQGQRRFKLWKFRSMIRDAHGLKAQLMAQNERQDGPLFKIEHDPRITRFGRFIRKTSLDELPQLINVLNGTMSLVGPRPHEPEEVARYEKHHKKLLTIKPGMTGMAQVSGRSNLTFEEEVRLDTYYGENWSLGLDFQILVRTPLAVLNTKSAA